MLHFTNYNPADRAGWLALREGFRKRGVGGSELASVAGVPGAFGSAYAEWAERTGRFVRERRDNPYLQDGRDIEAIVGRRFEEASGLKLRHRYAIIENDRCPHLFADVDAFVEGADMGWEGKTYDPRSSKFDDGVPPYYVSQVAVYMAVTEKDKWALSAWSYGQGTRHFFFTLNPDDEKPSWALEKVVLSPGELEAAETIASDFMRLVELNTPPPIDGSEATGEALRAIYPEAVQDKALDIEAVRSSLDAIGAIEQQIKELEQRKEEQRQIVMEAMGDAETATATGWKVTWKAVETKRLDTKAAKAALGDALAPYFKTTSARTLRITRAK